jgi:hypothetical protein
MKRITQRALIFFLLTMLPSLLTFADPPAPPGPGGSPIDNYGVAVGAHLDNGVIILLALGIGYAVYKLYELRQKARAEA